MFDSFVHSVSLFASSLLHNIPRRAVIGRERFQARTFSEFMALFKHPGHHFLGLLFFLQMVGGVGCIAPLSCFYIFYFIFYLKLVQANTNYAEIVTIAGARQRLWL